MAEVTGNIIGEIINSYNLFISGLPLFAGQFVNLFLLVLLVVLFSVFIWKVHQFIAKKNIIELNLNQYNKSEHPFFTKVLAGILYFIEYIIILPFLVFVWFSVFALFLIVLSGGTIEIGVILIISAIVVASIRMTSYYNEDLSREIAKLLPFTLLAFSILNFTSISIDKISGHISKIPFFLESILIYLGFIIFLELILRFFDFIFSLFGVDEIPDVEEN